MFVTVDARPTVQPASALEVVATNAGDSQGALFFLDSTAFPVTFTVTPSGRLGDLRIDVAAVQELGNDRLLRARGSATAVIVPGERVALDVMLEPNDFVVETNTAGDQATTLVPDGPNGRQLAAAADGSFLIAFASGCAPDCEVRARWFDARANPIHVGGTPDTGDFLVAQAGASKPMIATAAAEDRAIVAWVGARATPPGTEMRAAVLTAAGVVADDIVIDSGGMSDPVADPHVVILGSGEILVTWRHGPVDAAARRGRLLSQDGMLVGNVITGTNEGFDIGPAGPGASAAVAATGEGRGFVAVWSDGGNVLARFFDPDGLAHTEAPVVLTSHADAIVRGAHVAWDGAAAVVAWDAVAEESPDTGTLLAGRFLPPNGTPESTPVVLAEAPAGSTGVPDVAIRDDGTIAAAWHDCGAGSDDSGCGIRMRMLDPDGVSLGEPFIANTTTAGDQREPAIAASRDAFIVTWTDHSATGLDTSGSAVRARAVYVPAGAGVTRFAD